MDRQSVNQLNGNPNQPSNHQFGSGSTTRSASRSASTSSQRAPRRARRGASEDPIRWRRRATNNAAWLATYGIFPHERQEDTYDTYEEDDLSYEEWASTYGEYYYQTAPYYEEEPQYHPPTFYEGEEEQVGQHDTLGSPFSSLSINDGPSQFIQAGYNHQPIAQSGNQSGGTHHSRQPGWNAFALHATPVIAGVSPVMPVDGTDFVDPEFPGRADQQRETFSQQSENFLQPGRSLSVTAAEFVPSRRSDRRPPAIAVGSFPPRHQRGTPAAAALSGAAPERHERDWEERTAEGAEEAGEVGDAEQPSSNGPFSTNLQVNMVRLEGFGPKSLDDVLFPGLPPAPTTGGDAGSWSPGVERPTEPSSRATRSLPYRQPRSASSPGEVGSPTASPAGSAVLGASASSSSGCRPSRVFLDRDPGSDDEDRPGEVPSAVPTRGQERGGVLCAISESRSGEVVGVASVALATGTVEIVKVINEDRYQRLIDTLWRLPEGPHCFLVLKKVLDDKGRSLLADCLVAEYPGVPIVPYDRKYWRESGAFELVKKLGLAHEVKAVRTALEGNFYVSCALAAVCLLSRLGYSLNDEADRKQALSYIQNELDIAFERGSLRIKFSEPANAMGIDRFTATSLELVQNTRQARSKRSTLLKVLDTTRTPQGRRLLRSTLLQPSTDTATIEQRYDAVEELVTSEELFSEVINCLKGLLHIDIERLGA